MREGFLGNEPQSPRKETSVARKKKGTPTEVELEFLQVVWEGGEVTTDDVRGALRKQGRSLSDGSVRKVLSILEEKGYVSRRPQGRGFLYRAIVPKEKANRRMVTDLLKRAFGGSAALMVASLMDSRAVSKKDVEEIRRIIEERERESRR